MGDTGALAIGAGLACSPSRERAPAAADHRWLFVIETVSVVLQVGSFRLFRRRVFRMAPIHHHFELGGWPETTVIIRFWILPACRPPSPWASTTPTSSLHRGFVRTAHAPTPRRPGARARASPGRGRRAAPWRQGVRRRSTTTPTTTTRAIADGARRRPRRAPDATPRAAGRGADAVVPSPGRARSPPGVRRAEPPACRSGPEFDLAARWDDRPVRRHHRHRRQDHGDHAGHRRCSRPRAGGRRRGQHGRPAGRRHRRPDIEVFVVEASSFRLATRTLRPRRRHLAELRPRPPRRATPTWRPTRRPRRIWRRPAAPTRWRSATPTTRWCRPSRPGPVVTFGLGSRPTTVVGRRRLVARDGDRWSRSTSCPALPHDVANALAAGDRVAGGATPRGRPRACSASGASPTGSALVGEADGVRWYDDSKATDPATLAPPCAASTPSC